MTVAAESGIAADSRAIVVTEVVAMGGAERSVLALSRWLHERGLHHHFVAYRDYHADLVRHAGYPVRIVELKPEPSARKKVASLRRYFAENRRSPRPLCSGYQAALHVTLAGQRGFHTLMHDTPSLFGVRKMTWKDKLRLDLSNRILTHGLRSGGRTIVTSEFLRKETRRFFGVDATIARMGGMSSGAGVKLRPVGEQLRMLSVSRLEKNKRIDWMLRALAAMERGPEPLSGRVDWRLEVAGKGSQMEALAGLAQNLGLGERVQLHGFLSDAELEHLYDETHLFLMPAVQGYGIPAIEALARGIPVLLHRESGVSDILLETPWATVLHGDESQMEAAMRKAIEGVIAGRHLREPLPALPTEEAWAEQVASLCGWL